MACMSINCAAGAPKRSNGSRNSLTMSSREVRELQAAHDRERDQLYAQIGRLTTELEWLKKKGGGDHAAR